MSKAVIYARESREGPEHSFSDETEYICRRLCMCENFQTGCILKPHECPRAMKKVAGLKQCLVLGNNPLERMSFEDIRVAKDYFFFVD